MENIKIYSADNPLSREQFNQIYDIIRLSFPPNEHRGFDGQYGEFGNKYFRCMCVGGEKITGFMNFWELSGFIYLEHFAVAREMRKKGIGSILLNELKKYAANRPIVLEVELPETGETAVRRIEYYKQRGFFVNEYEYYQPPYNDGDEPLKMFIMSCPKPLSPKEFGSVRDVLYRDAYETDGKFGSIQ